MHTYVLSSKGTILNVSNFQGSVCISKWSQQEDSPSSKYWSGKSRGGGGAGVSALVLAGEIGDKD